MCEACEQALVSVMCKVDVVALCVTCNFDIDSANPLARRHKHILVETFFDSAESVIKSGALLTDFLMVPIDHNKSPEASWMKLGYGERVMGKRGSGFWWGLGEVEAARERMAATEDEGLGYGVRPMVKPISPFSYIYNVVLYLYLDFGFAFKLHCLLT
nr:zinc finger protein constans-like 5 [Quercus suber]